MTPKDLRKKYPVFIYKDYSLKFCYPHLQICYFFQIPPDFKFKTKILIKNIPKLKRGPSCQTLKQLIFHLGLMEMLNYWKLTSSAKIKIEAGSLNKEQLQFLKKVIFRGMGQYFYQNRIDFTEKNFLKIETLKKQQSSLKAVKTVKIKLKTKKYLIPIGGGKDSIVTLELLSGAERELGSFVFNPRKPQSQIIKIAALKENILVERKLDVKLFRLNRAGFLNGHVPFSAYLAFLALILAYLFDYKFVAFSWEKSSSEPNLKYRRKWINHQWSKSSEFEKLFQQYAKKYLLEDIEVFSALRNFSELEIAEIFSKLEKYHFAFVSCNNVYKINRGEAEWCGKCPKCLFVFLTLYPFLEEEKLIRIFGKNLLKNKKLLPLLEQLLGRKKFKPFECVGTRKEMLDALKLSIKKSSDSIGKIRKLPFLLNYFNKK